MAEEHAALGAALAAAPQSFKFKGVMQFHRFGRALDDARHPDHRLAKLFGGADMVRLPLLGRSAHVKLLTAALPRAELNRPATAADVAAIAERLFGPQQQQQPALHRSTTILDLYEFFVSTEQFQTACGRISASYAW